MARRPLWDRLWEKVIVEGDCWRFTGTLRNGYGRVHEGSPGRRHLTAHRAAYELLVGPIPAGLECDHLCRNRACVNPDHLELVTHGVNVLRGNGASARAARMTVCGAGHPLAPPNVYISNGKRRCRTCNLKWQKAKRAGHEARRRSEEGSEHDSRAS